MVQQQLVIQNAVLVILGVQSHTHASTHALISRSVLCIAHAVPHYELLFFFSFVSFNFLFIFSKVIFNFFCVGYSEGIPGGILTLISFLLLHYFVH